MSHIVSVQTQVRDPVAIRAACGRLSVVVRSRPWDSCGQQVVLEAVSLERQTFKDTKVSIERFDQGHLDLMSVAPKERECISIKRGAVVFHNRLGLLWFGRAPEGVVIRVCDSSVVLYAVVEFITYRGCTCSSYGLA